MREVPARGVNALHRALHSRGAGDSGLAALTVVTVLQTAADALVAVALAGTMFFSVPTGEARGNVAVYLLVTMAPFVLLAPLVGPLLDRYPHWRRYVLAATALGRALLCWYLVGALDDIGLYPAALGVLVLSKAFHISRAAAVPRVLPHEITLVAANSRLSVAAFAGGAVSVTVGGAVSWLAGPSWVLWLGLVAFAGLAVLSLRLPDRIDGSPDELHVTLVGGTRPLSVPAWVAFDAAAIAALRSAAALRLLAGFLTLFLVFVIREERTGLAATLLLGLLAAAAGGGAVIGASAGLRLPLARPEVTAVWLLGAVTAVCVLGALSFSLSTGLLVAFVSAVAASLGKLASDAVIQREVPERLRVSAFGRSETLLQLAWVAGGFLGILLPITGSTGFVVLTVIMALAWVAALASLRQAARARAAGPRDEDVPGER